MILRLVALMSAGGMAYVLLGGWPAELPAMARALVAILLIVMALVWWATLGRKDDALPLATALKKPGWLDFGAIGLIFLTLECGFLWLLTAAPQPLEEIALKIEQRFRPESAEQREESTIGLKPGNWLWKNARQRVLPTRTNLKQGMKPEVFVRLVNVEDAERLMKRQVYVRAFALDQFEDGVWSASEAMPERIEADEQGWVRFSELREEEILHEVFHAKNETGSDVLTALQGIRAVRVPYLDWQNEGLALLSENSQNAGYEYLASSWSVRLEDVDVARFKEVEMAKPDSKSRIGELVSKVAGEGDLVERLKKIEAHLQENYRYSLVTDNRRSLDPLENFLFEEKRGHCEFFATAGALMTRQLGVEARIAFGWVGGKYYENAGMFVFRALEAHAWVEVKLEGYGWVLMEPTPPVVLGGGGLPRIANAEERVPGREEVLEESEEIFRRESENLAGWTLGLGMGCAVAAGILLWLRNRKQVVTKGVALFSFRGNPEVGYLAAWRRALGRRGILKRGGLTLRGQAESLKPSPSFSKELVRYHYAIKYEEQPVDRKREQAIEREIDAWEKED